MTTTPTAPPVACVTGCVRPGHHAPGCPDECRCHRRPDEHRRGCDGRCPGCEPRPAEHGLLCPWCWQRLLTDVAAAPALVAHLRELGEPYAQTTPASDGKSYRDPAEAPLRPATWEAADEIHALLAHYAHLIRTEHPLGPRMVGPDETGSVRSRTTVAEYQGETYLRRSSVSGLADPPPAPRVWRDAIRVARDGKDRPILDRDGEPIRYLVRVLVPRPRPQNPATATARLAGWLMPLLPWCAAQPWAGIMRRELAEAIATTSARWPTPAMVERDRAIAMPCPRCDLHTLTYAPPSFEHAPFKVSCSNPDCARIWTEDEWANFVYTVTAADRRTGRRAPTRPATTKTPRRADRHEHDWQPQGDDVVCTAPLPGGEKCDATMPVTWTTRTENAG